MRHLVWLWEKVVPSLVAAVIIFGGGIVLGLLRAHGSDLAGPLLYGLAGSASLLVLMLGTYAVFMFRRMAAERMTPEHADDSVRRWLRGFGMTVTDIACPPESDEVFKFRFQPMAGPKPSTVLVAQLKDQPRYLVLQSTTDLSVEQRDLFASMGVEERERVFGNIKTELERARVKYDINLPRRLTVLKRIPITGNLTQDSFAEHLDMLTSDSMIATNRLEMELPS